MKYKRVNTIRGYENIMSYYYVVDLGLIVSFYSNDKPKILKTQKSRFDKDNRMISLRTVEGKSQICSLANLVGLAFDTEPVKYYFLINIDEDSNYSVNNISIKRDFKFFETHMCSMSIFKTMCKQRNEIYNDYYNISTNIKDKKGRVLYYWFKKQI